MRIAKAVKVILPALLVANPITVGSATGIYRSDAKGYKILFISKVKGIPVFADAAAGGRTAAKENGDTFE